MKRDFEQTVVSPDLLRDVADHSRLERGWQRLEEDLEFSIGEETSTSSNLLLGTRLPKWTMAVAAGAMCFYAGWQFAPHQASGPVTATPATGDHAPSGPHRASHASDDAPNESAELSSPSPEERPETRRPSSPIRSRPTTPSSASSATANTPAPWMTACEQGDFAQAVKLFELTDAKAGDLSHTPAQLMCLSSGNETHGQSSAATAVLEQVIRDHPDDPYAVAAASNLARIHQAAGDDEKARHYRQLAQKLSKGSLLSEAALCNKIAEAAEAKLGDQLRRLSDRYQTQFPHGPCSDKIAPWLLEQERHDKKQAELRAAEEAKADGSAPSTESNDAPGGANSGDISSDPYETEGDDDIIVTPPSE